MINMPEYSRREFLATTAVTAAGMGLGLLSNTRAASADEPLTDVWVIHGNDKVAQMTKALQVIAENGGLGEHADTLTLKVNAAWARTPEQGANTNPVLVETFLKGCRDFGVRKLTVPEHPCNRAAQSFPRSGIEEAVKKAGARMIDLKTKQKSFKKVELPLGRNLNEAEVAAEFLETDVLVNMPVAKHHSSARLTMAMKNWLGAVRDRRYWHKNNLHQCIADFSSFIQPDWTLIDATRIMLDKGPQGPTENMKHPQLLIVSRDQVAADAFASTLFVDDPREILYLKFAEEMGVGPIDPARMNLHRLEA
jgi:uncharacterized protein (DUF362 family)